MITTKNSENVNKTPYSYYEKSRKYKIGYNYDVSTKSQFKEAIEVIVSCCLL